MTAHRQLHPTVSYKLTIKAVRFLQFACDQQCCPNQFWLVEWSTHLARHRGTQLGRDGLEELNLHFRVQIDDFAVAATIATSNRNKDKMLSYRRETALQGELVLAKSEQEQGDNILRTL